MRGRLGVGPMDGCIKIRTPIIFDCEQADLCCIELVIGEVCSKDVGSGPPTAKKYN